MFVAAVLPEDSGQTRVGQVQNQIIHNLLRGFTVMLTGKSHRWGWGWGWGWGVGVGFSAVYIDTAQSGEQRDQHMFEWTC